MYRVMFKTIPNSGMYIRYVNEHYGKDLKPIKEKLIGLTRIQEEKVVENTTKFLKRHKANGMMKTHFIKRIFAHIYHVA